MRIRQPKLLLFHCMENGLTSVQLSRLRQIAGVLHLQLTLVPKDQFQIPLGMAAGAENWKNALLSMPPVQDEALTEDILVLAGLRGEDMDRLLSMMRAQSVRISLKAVLTEHNVNWNILQLQHELTRERDSIHGAAGQPRRGQ